MSQGCAGASAPEDEWSDGWREDRWREDRRWRRDDWDRSRWDRNEWDWDGWNRHSWKQEQQQDARMTLEEHPTDDLMLVPEALPTPLVRVSAEMVARSPPSSPDECRELVLRPGGLQAVLEAGLGENEFLEMLHRSSGAVPRALTHLLAAGPASVAPPPLAWQVHGSRPRCANTHCWFLIHSDPQYGPFCCGRCWARSTGAMRGNRAHGPFCERIEANDPRLYQAVTDVRPPCEVLIGPSTGSSSSGHAQRV